MGIDNVIKEIDILFKGFTVIPLEEKYIAKIAELEKVCFSCAWSENAILDSFKAGTKFFVAMSNDNVLGYAGINAILDEGYITNIAVFPNERGRGIGTALLKRLFSLAGDISLSFISLEVRESNLAAISLYEKLGFKVEGKRKNFYRDPQEDGLIMTKRFED